MNISGKYNSIKNKLHLLKMKRKNKYGEFIYAGKELSPVVRIQMEKGSKCRIGNIWAGAGPVTLKVIGDGTMTIGNNVCINSNCFFVCRQEVFIGDDVMFGPNVVLFDHDHDYRSSRWKDKYKSSEIVIGNHVWIGANVVILRGTRIGDNCVIGAGTVIKGRIEDNSIVYGGIENKVKKYSREI